MPASAFLFAFVRIHNRQRVLKYSSRRSSYHGEESDAIAATFQGSQIVVFHDIEANIAGGVSESSLNQFCKVGDQSIKEAIMWDPYTTPDRRIGGMFPQPSIPVGKGHGVRTCDSPKSVNTLGYRRLCAPEGCQPSRRFRNSNSVMLGRAHRKMDDLSQHEFREEFTGNLIYIRMRFPFGGRSHKPSELFGRGQLALTIRGLLDKPHLPLGILPWLMLIPGDLKLRAVSGAKYNILGSVCPFASPPTLSPLSNAEQFPISRGGQAELYHATPGTVIQRPESQIYLAPFLHPKAGTSKRPRNFRRGPGAMKTPSKARERCTNTPRANLPLVFPLYHHVILNQAAGLTITPVTNTLRIHLTILCAKLLAPEMSNEGPYHKDNEA
ncbi:hypothetical protein BS47DRAFT_1396442 [Hydnum rufescens UP504]|uniref:Uncharacterized protein n=1 Tax=Hydnum rufescens UP504 TaxID=1448309 RepID=A0A9P6DPD5_9AGAM|nr:hypothetical protein BS47DRAFT_1396442 [Hydnum rufescens UP504]